MLYQVQPRAMCGRAEDDRVLQEGDIRSATAFLGRSQTVPLQPLEEERDLNVICR